MKALFVGLGSIGRRHLQNLSAECERRGIALEVTALRHTDRPLPDSVVSLVKQQVSTLEPARQVETVLTPEGTLHPTESRMDTREQGRQYGIAPTCKSALHPTKSRIESWEPSKQYETEPAHQAAAYSTEGRMESLGPGEYFDLAFICNPTHLHAEAIRSLQGRVGAFFIEKPIVESASSASADLGLADGQKAYVAAPMRWCGVYLALKKQLEVIKKTNQGPFSVRVICSSYLPDWRPGTDYREVYSAKREMGGGVALDLIHEWDYLVDLFGVPEKTQNFRGRYSHLEIDSDDLSIYIAHYPSFLCEVHLDYFGRVYRRTAEFFLQSGTLTADFGAGTLTLPDGSLQDHQEPVNTRYEREIAYFLDYALGESVESINSPAKALETLKLTLGR